MKKLFPWLVSTLLFISLVVLYLHYTHIIFMQEAEIKASHDKNISLAIDAANKLKEVNDRVTAANEKLQQITTEADAKLQEANQPEPTISVTFRKAFLHSGEVAMITNTSSESITVSLLVTRTATNQQKNFNFVIDSHMRKDIGENEGWAFLNGDTLKITQPNHKTISLTK